MKKWFVLYTKPNQELKVARHLEEAGISSYCPIISIIKQYSDRKKKIIKPLISSFMYSAPSTSFSWVPVE